MNEVDIEQAMKDLLENNMTGLPASVAWPNQKHDRVRPYLEVIFSGGQRTGGALAGGETILQSVGVMLINVVTEQNTATATANAYADTLAALFYEGRMIAITGGTITLMKPADIRKGLNADADWRVPVVVNYQADKT